MRCPKSTLNGRYGEELPDLIAFVCKTGYFFWRLGLDGRATSATGLGYGAERYFGDVMCVEEENVSESGSGDYM